MKAALFGFGYWGQKVYSTLKSLGVEVEIIEKKHLSTKKTTLKKTVLNDPKVNYCFIVTPEETHFALAKECLLANKHVFVEKPLALTVEQAKELKALAESKNLYLAVDQVFLYDKSLLKVRQLIVQHKLSKLKSVFSKRWSSLSQPKNISIIHDLLPHDLYILEFLNLLDCSTLNKNDINNSIEKQEFLVNRSVFSFSIEKTKFIFDYDWYAKQVEREMIFDFIEGKITWIKKNGFDEVTFYQQNQKLIEEKLNFSKPSPLELLISDFFAKKTKLPLAKTINQLKLINYLLN
ncbi:MAG: Gfo/Idh/MocA family protein [Patescibacteria group bacterium]